ncbi:MAG: tetratricopeptide repeat protein [Nitrosopumilaceae archaeon]
MVSIFNYPKRRLRKLFEEGEYTEALELGKALEKKNPYDPDLFFIIGSIYYINGDAKNTLSYLDKVLEINKYDEEALLLKASVHLHLKNKKEALDCCEKIREIDPKSDAIAEILDKLEEN